MEPESRATYLQKLAMPHFKVQTTHIYTHISPSHLHTNTVYENVLLLNNTVSESKPSDISISAIFEPYYAI